MLARDVKTRFAPEGDPRAIARGLRAIIAAADQLIACPDLDSLYYRAVTIARDSLGLERCGILIKDGEFIRGTYGTDIHGKVLNEGFVKISRTARWTRKLFRRRGLPWNVYEEDHYTFDGGKQRTCGHGWVVITPIVSSQEQIGVLCNDSAITDAPLDPTKQEVVAVFCSLLGDIIQRKRLEMKILEVSEREQERIGVDLHDGLCQHLSATALAAGLLEQKLIGRAPTEATAARRIVELLNQATSQARNLAKCLYPVALDTVGLAGAIEQLAQNAQTLADVKCRFECNRAPTIRDAQVARHLYRIAQEATTNALKHAAADNIVIRLKAQRGRITLTIEDDGTGIRSGSKTGGIGLNIMAHRAEAIGAALNVAGNPTGGTIVTCKYEERRQNP